MGAQGCCPGEAGGACRSSLCSTPNRAWGVPPSATSPWGCTHTHTPHPLCAPTLSPCSHTGEEMGGTDWTHSVGAKCVPTCTLTHTPRATHRLPCTPLPMLMCTHVHTHACSCTPPQPGTHVHTQPCEHTMPCVQRHTYTVMREYTRCHVCRLSCVHAPTCRLTCQQCPMCRMCTHSHTCAHTVSCVRNVYTQCHMCRLQRAQTRALPHRSTWLCVLSHVITHLYTQLTCVHALPCAPPHAHHHMHKLSHKCPSCAHTVTHARITCAPLSCAHAASLRASLAQVPGPSGTTAALGQHPVPGCGARAG